MFKQATFALRSAARQFFSAWPVLAAGVGLYAVLLAALYLFFTTPEAQLWQLGLTLLSAVTAPILFFMLQTLAVSYTHGQTALGSLLRQAGRDFWKLFVVSLPVGLLALLLYFALGWLNLKLSPHPEEAQSVVVSGLKAFCFWLALPLLTAHLWVAAAREGLAALKHVGQTLQQAFAPRSVLIYALGWIVFGLLPYALFFTRTPVKSAWLDLALLGARITLALLLALVGWMVTLGALALVNKAGLSQLSQPQPGEVRQPTEIPGSLADGQIS